MTISNSNIYTNVWEIVKNTDYFFYIFISGRGIGKTYSCLKGVIDDDEIFMYLRRTEEELKDCCTPSKNPYKTLNRDEGWDIRIKMENKQALILDYTQNEDTPILRGYGNGLSTSGKVRGTDFSDVNYIIHDEFINTSPINRFKNSANYLFNLIETVQRNREFNGKPLKIICLSNANTIDDDIIRTLKLAEEIRRMKNDNITLYTDKERGIYLELLDNKKVRDMKEKTRLYRLTKGTTFYDMALNNEFTTDFFGDVKMIRSNELTPIVCYEKIYFYRHKSKGIIYASNRKAQCRSYNKHTLQAFKRDYGFMIGNAIERGNILYQNYDIKLDTINIF